MEDHEESWFLTLTYNDDCLPTHDCVNMETGEIYELHSLQLRDVQLFIKRLRKYCDAHSLPKIRYFAAGEYGSSTFRPHYHMIVFGLHIDDLEVYKKNVGSYRLFKSDTINRIWNKGFVVIGRADWATVAYTARYIVKKAYGSERRTYDDLGIASEFAVMSRKPGIGGSFFERNPECVEKGRISVATDDGGRSFAPPRYFKKKYDVLLEEIDPEAYVTRKELMQRESLEQQKAVRELLAAQSNKSYLEILAMQEENKLAQVAALKRGDF